MSRTQRILARIVPQQPLRVLVRAATVCAVAGLVLLALSLRRIERLPTDGTPLKFEAARAHAIMRTLAKEYPYRLPWHANRVKAGDWIASQFRSWGYQPKEMIFSTVVASKRYANMRNIYVELPGTERPNEIIMVLAHYDTPDTTVEGAMDDAGGVGVVMELARVFAKEKPRRTMIFLTTDSEEFGAFWGARTFAREFPRARKIVGALNLDFPAAGKQIGILNLHDGLKQGFTPLWLRELALDSIRSLGDVEASDFSGLMEFVERALLIPPSDHGALLAAGIPTVAWVGQNEDFGALMAKIHHTHNDVAEIMEPETFRTYGQPAERFMRSIDALPKIPKNFRDHRYYKLSERYYIPGAVVTLLHILCFIPFLLFSLSKFGHTLVHRPEARINTVLGNEAKNLFMLIGALLVGYGLMRMLPELKVITEYEVFPATQKSAMLYSPNILAILLVLATVGLVYWAMKRVFSEGTDAAGHVDIRHTFHGIMLTLLITAAFAKNSYLAVLLLLPPAYLWSFVRVGRGTQDRFINLMLLLGGTITMVALVVVMTTVFHVGVAYWYIFLSAAYGLFSAYAVVLFLVAIAIMIRLFRSFVWWKQP
ncbi:MAG: M28 family peptidase [Bdellovibrionales bacterium]|nr:M28 family peptidase [Bdellovibrionales bacterium]